MQPNATYSISPGSPQPAVVILRKDAVHIYSLQQDRTVIWHYDQIVQDEIKDHVFAYAAYPPQLITLQNNEVAQQLTLRLQKSRQAFFSRRRSTFLKVAAGLTLFLVLIYFFLLPLLAAAFVDRFPLSYEKELGDELYLSLKQGFDVDGEKTLYINDFFQQLHIRSRYPVQITVVKGDVANAFAIPGGRIVVYDKLLNRMTSYPELAALLTHEFTHVENRHSLKSLFRQLGSALFLTMLFGDAGAVGDALLGNANELKNLSYSRSLEREADENGVVLLRERSIDCYGFVRLFQLLQKESSAEPSEWISSHPNLSKRIRNIQQHRQCRQQQGVTNTTLHYLFLKLKRAS